MCTALFHVWHMPVVYSATSLLLAKKKQKHMKTLLFHLLFVSLCRIDMVIEVIYFVFLKL